MDRTCIQKTADGLCGKPAVSIMHWPGYEEGLYVCGECKEKAVAVGRAMGFTVQFEDLPRTVTDEIRDTLEWMVADLDARRNQGPNGLDADPLSPEMQLAHKLLEDLRAGKIECRRIA